MLDNVDKLKADTDEWDDYEENVVNFITSKFSKTWTESEIERAIGVLRTNAYCVEAGDSGSYGMVRLIYPQLSMM